LTDEQNQEKERHVHLERGIPIFTPPLEDPDPQKRREREAEATYRDNQLSLQRNILLTQIGLVFFGLLGAGIGIWQANSARYSVEIADRSVLLAQKTERDSRVISEKQLTEAAKQFDETLRQMANQTNAQRDSAKAAVDGVKAVHDQMRLDQRAWVAAYKMESVIPKGSQIPVGANVLYSNTGRTPAFNFRVHEAWRQTEAQIPQYDDDPAQSNAPYPVTTLAPNEIGNSPGVSHPDHVASINAGNPGGFAYGTLWYDDFMGGHHWIQYCFEIAPKFAFFQACRVHHKSSDSPKQR